MPREAGTVVQHRDGYIFVKTAGGKWQPQGRWVIEHENHVELKPNEKVYHMDGDRTNNDLSNLVVITFRDTPFRMLARSRVLYIPRTQERHEAQRVTA